MNELMNQLLNEIMNELPDRYLAGGSISLPCPLLPPRNIITTRQLAANIFIMDQSENIILNQV